MFRKLRKLKNMQSDNIKKLSQSKTQKEIFFVGGASGSGKTAIKENLQEMLGEKWTVYDFDEIEIPENLNNTWTGTKWRQETTEKWLQKIINHDRNVCLVGQIVLGEILACPSAEKILSKNLSYNNQSSKIQYCLLDVIDFERIRRLKERDQEQENNKVHTSKIEQNDINQNTLNWATWLRMHIQDPQWEQHVITENPSNLMNFKAWNESKTWDTLANVYTLDSTYLPIQKVACKISEFILENSWKNRVIFINGASSTGKTTLSKALQNKLPYPYLHMALDTVIGMMPDNTNDWGIDNGKIYNVIVSNEVKRNKDNIVKGFYWKTDTDIDNNPLAYIQMGPFARQIVSLVKETILTALRAGFRVIIDEVCNTKSSYNLWQELLKPYHPIYVGLETDPRILEERERKRGDRMIGSARAQALTIHRDKIYDLMFDTQKLSMEEIANQIIEKIEEENIR